MRLYVWFPAIATAMLNTCRHLPKKFSTPADTCPGRCYAQVCVLPTVIAVLYTVIAVLHTVIDDWHTCDSSVEHCDG